MDTIGSCEDLNLPNCQSGTGELAGSGLTDIIGTIFFFIGVIATIYLVISGIQYSVSGGDPNKVEQAKNSIIYAVVGVVLSFSVFVLMRFLFAGEGGEFGL